jgi:hypothetical protein
MNTANSTEGEPNLKRPLVGLALGNSHLAAVRLAYSIEANRPKGINLDFLGSGKGGLADIELDHGDLVATSSATAADFLRFGGRERVPLGEYDFFLIVGLGFNVFGLEPLYREYRCAGLKKWQTADPKRTLVSQAAMKQMIATGLKTSLSARVANIIRQGSTKPIIQVAQPRPAENFLQQKRFPSLRRSIARGDAAALGDYFEAAAPLACIQHYLPQPPITVSQGLLTGATFTENAPRLTADDANLRHQSADDFLHANGSYGIQILHDLGLKLATL